MCGIAGIKKNSLALDEGLLIQMRDSFVYRGPDDAGLWHDLDHAVGMAHRRLSILDPTPSGHQPMKDTTNGNVICFNGEIYNYIEVRDQLKLKGHVFSTGTDTEVLLKAYLEYGEDCLSHFNGMFAFAIWDRASNKLFMARDRLGIKPFYYRLTDAGDFYFASEVKAIRLTQNKPSELHMDLIDQYMSFGYVPGEQTLEKGIQRLLPGHKAVLQNGQLQVEKYWDLEFHQEQDLGFEYYLEKSRELLNSAIDLRLRSDVPLGIFLSGGLDSSAIVGLLAQRSTQRLKTFSVAYDFGKDFNETDYSRMVSEKFDTDHHEMFLTTDQFKRYIPDFAHIMDEPVTESAAISLQYLSQRTKDDVTVVLSGEGSDEIFAGYDLYQYMRTIEKYRSITGSTLAGVVSKVGSSLLPENSKLRKYLMMSGQVLDDRYKGISTYESRHKSALYNYDYQQHLASGDQSDVIHFLSGLFSKTRGKDPLSRMLYFDTKTWLVDDLLIKADRMSMAASLELRVPFLDYRLVEFAATIPSKYKIRDGEGKFILKEMMKDILPSEIIYRKKMGFPTPLKMMFQGDMAEYARETLLGSNTKIHDIFNKDYISLLLDEHLNAKQDHHRILWQLVVLEEWFQNVGNSLR
jgi:asparagine synthase (glutamine-hydrolysing)